MSTPLRIASLLASATEILYGLGLGNQIVGVSHECDFPAAATSHPRLTRSHVEDVGSSGQIDLQVKEFTAAGRSLYALDERRLVELAPDVIVTQAQCDVCAIKYDDVVSLVQRHPSLSHTRIVALSPNSLSDVFADIHRIGHATSRQSAADAFVAQLTQRVERVRQATADLIDTQRPRVVCVEWVEPLMIAANWTPQLVEIAGGQNGLSQVGKHSEYSSWDQVVAYDPEVLLLMPCGFALPRTMREIATMPILAGWREMTAIRNDRVFAIDGNAYFNRSGPRLVDSVEILAHLLHPTRFAAPAGIPAPNQAWCTFST